MVSSSSRLNIDFLFQLFTWDFGAPAAGLRGSRRMTREKMNDWMKKINVLRVFRIGIMRLLAPDVNWSTSAVDMSPPTDGRDLTTNNMRRNKRMRIKIKSENLIIVNKNEDHAKNKKWRRDLRTRLYVVFIDVLTCRREREDEKDMISWSTNDRSHGDQQRGVIWWCGRF